MEGAPLVKDGKLRNDNVLMMNPNRVDILRRCRAITLIIGKVYLWFVPFPFIVINTKHPPHGDTSHVLLMSRGEILLAPMPSRSATPIYSIIFCYARYRDVCTSTKLSTCSTILNRWREYRTHRTGDRHLECRERCVRHLILFWSGTLHVVRHSFFT